MKFLNTIGGWILLLILYCLASPWIIARSVGAIFGSLAHSFMIGMSKGASALDRINVNIKYLQANKGDKPSDKEPEDRQ